jgi:hypothetical protein
MKPEIQILSEKLSTRDEKVYQLAWDLDHLLPDLEVDGWIREFPNVPDESAFWRIKENLNLPNPVIFDAVGAAIQNIDYPYMDVAWPIMSKRMLDTLLLIGDFRYRAYPILMVDCEQIYNKALSRNANSGLEFHNFAAVHILEDLDIFDWENSVYERSIKKPNSLRSFDKIVLKEPTQGFPPLFRIATVPLRTDLFVSAEARLALEVANIKGVIFRYLEGGVAGALP